MAEHSEERTMGSEDFEPCGSFDCSLPKGHNMGRADIPANHHSEEIEQVRERIARAIYKQGGYCGNCSFEGWDSCAECRRTLLGYADAVLDVLGLERVHWSEHHGGYLYRLAATEEIGMSRSIEQSPWEAYEALIESIMKNADHDFWDSGSDIEAVAYVRHLEGEVERLRRVCLRRALRTWVDEFDEEDDHG